jgi:hypothetical protein
MKGLSTPEVEATDLSRFLDEVIVRLPKTSTK